MGCILPGVKLSGCPNADRLPVRFWSKVDRSGGPDACWPWIASRQPRGAGQVGVGSTAMLAHRVAYLLARGELPDALMISHACGVLACVNPAHLYATAAPPGRSLPGERNGRAKLTADDVASIRRRYAGGERAAALAKEYGVGEARLQQVATGNGWRHVAPPGAPRQRRLSPDEAREIRRLHGDGERGADIARSFGVSGATVSRIVRGKAWRDA